MAIWMVRTQARSLSPHPSYPSVCNSPGSVLASVGPVLLFILLTINNLPALTAWAERSAIRSCSTDHFGKLNTIKACEKHEAIDGLFAGIQLIVREIRCQKLLGRMSHFGSKENTVKTRSTTIICMPAVVQTSQTTPHLSLRVIHSTVQI